MKSGDVRYLMYAKKIVDEARRRKIKQPSIEQIRELLLEVEASF